jgi:PKD repeat protein
MSATLIHGKTSGGGTHLPVKVTDNSDGTGVLVTTTSVAQDSTAGSAGFSVTVAAAATDVVYVYAETGTLYLRRIIINGTATAAAAVTLLLIQRSALNTGGTLTPILAVKFNGTGLVPGENGYHTSTNFASLGSDVGTVARQFLQVPSAAAGVTPVPLVFDFSETPFKLTGENNLALNLNGATVAGLVLNVTVEFERVT